MSTKTEQRRADLRARIIEAAQADVAAGGVDSLKARKLAAEAGCALGALYNVFDDLTAIKLAVNARTFERLGRHVADRIAALPAPDPRDILITLGRGYLEFAIEHPRLWQAMFDSPMPEDAPLPEWYVQGVDRLFAIISGPLQTLQPQASAEEIDLLTRMLFSAVHGIVHFGLEGRASAVPQAELERMITLLITAQTDSLVRNT